MRSVLVGVFLSALLAGVQAQDAAALRRGAEGVVYDADGRRIGPVVQGATVESFNGPWTASTWVLLRVDSSTLVYFPLAGALAEGSQWRDPTKLVPIDYRPVFFDGPDCTGQAYVPLSFGLLGAPATTTLTDTLGAAVIYVGAVERPVDRIFASMRSTLTRCEATYPSAVTSVPVRKVVDLGSMYRAPYRLR